MNYITLILKIELVTKQFTPDLNLKVVNYYNKITPTFNKLLKT
jgi:hypothetical protein